MSTFRIRPMEKEAVRDVRARAFASEPDGVLVSVAGETGYGPCRSCLRQIAPGERRILFSYKPECSDEFYGETGPVFIHADDCAAYGDAGVFPPEVENGRIPFPLAFRAYGAKGTMIGAVLPSDTRAEETIDELFANDRVAYVHVRNRQFGCFVCRVDRAE